MLCIFAYQSMNIAPSVPKVRALSPNYVRPVQRGTLQHPPTPPNPQPRGMLLTQAPPRQGIRIRAPSVQSSPAQQRMPVVNNHLQLRPQSVQLNQQPTATTRPVLVNNSASAVKQVVQIRAASIQQPQVKQLAGNIVKNLPAKANVIVLHKNSPAARNIVASRVRELFIN